MTTESSIESRTAKHREITVPEVAIVHLDQHLRSKILTNFYRNIPKFKLNSTIIIEDNIALSNEIMYHTNSQSIPPQLLYRGSRDGFNSKDFHSRCDNQGPTLTIIKSAEPYNQIFGAFLSESWICSPSPLLGSAILDGSAFIFKIEQSNNGSDGNSNQLFRKFNIKQNRILEAAFADKNYMPTFGAGYDIFIANDCNLNNSWTEFGCGYELPPGIEFRSEQARSYLAGSYEFKVSEIEVFKISITN